jgi:hypothetical protein
MLPFDQLIPVADDVWVVRDELRLAPAMFLPLASTVIRLPQGGIWVHSPVRIGQSAAAIDAFGPVQFVVAPSGLHHLHVRAAVQRWPNAQVLASPAVAAKQPELAVAPLTTGSLPWGPEIEALPLGGLPGIEEWVFFHRPSRTLLVTDLVFHLLHVRGWASHLAYLAFGTRHRLAVSRLFRAYIRDRAALAASVDAMLNWPFVRVIPCHGEVLEQDAHARMQAALSGLRAPVV